MSDDWLKDKLEKMDNKLDSLNGKVETLEITTAKQEVHLSEHIKRTAIAEENINMLRQDFKPVQKHVYMVNGGLKLIGLISTIAATVWYFLNLKS